MNLLKQSYMKLRCETGRNIMGKTILMSAFCLLAITAMAQPPITQWPEGTTDQWRGFTRHCFEFNGCSAWVAEPKQPAPGNPWVWCMEFPDAFADRTSGLKLLERGYYYAYISGNNTFGSPHTLETFGKFYEQMVKLGLAQKTVLIGISRGGLYAYRFAAANPGAVSVIYGDAPVCDFKSWPGGKGKGVGSYNDWLSLLKCYEFKTEAEALAYKGNPIDVLKPLAKNKIALINVVGDADNVVPPKENTDILAQRYRRLGGTINIIRKPGVGHHPHGLDNCDPVVNFILAHNVLK